MNILNLKTPNEIKKIISSNVKRRRKELHLNQEELAKRADVSYGSIKRFESKGEISLNSLIKIAIVLDCADDLIHLFERKQYNSIEEIINEQK